MLELDWDAAAGYAVTTRSLSARGARREMKQFYREREKAIEEG